MNSMLRRFMLKKEKKESEARQRLKKELFAFTRGINHGFPHKPTAFDYDSVLSLVAIGTKSGGLRVYGSPGVELFGQHPNGATVNQVYFIPVQARLVTLCLDDTIHLWEADVNTDLTSLRRIKTLLPSDSKFEDVFQCCVSHDGSFLLMMNKAGALQEVDVANFVIPPEKPSVPLNVILAGIPDDLANNVTRVVSFLTQPSFENKYLIGYSSGLIIQWDHSTKKPERYFSSNQAMESLSFSPDGTEFVSSHVDGSYIVWSTENSSRPKDQPACPYGPFPCKAIHAIKWRPVKSGDTYLVFSGGMPRASHSDKNTVTVMNNSSDHVVFELSSRVIDFAIVVSSSEEEHGDSSAEEEALSLLILAEEEFVAVDLLSPDWPTFKLPYLQNIQSSPILCMEYCCNVHSCIIDSLSENASFKERSSSRLSPRDWPITGGRNLNKNVDSYKLLLFGHEDGSIEFFSPTRSGMKLIYHLKTAHHFTLPQAQVGSGRKVADGDPDDLCTKRSFDEFDEWPPFRKVGTYDPHSDDPHLGIRHLLLSRNGQVLIAAGNSGQIMVFEFFKREKGGAMEQIEVTTANLNVVEEDSGYSWVGHDPLTFYPSKSKPNSDAGYQLMMLIQVLPPVEPTCIALDNETNLLSIGTVYGYAVFDLLHNKVVMTKRTLTSHGSTRFPFKGGSLSLKKTFRDSFRRLRRKKGSTHPSNSTTGGGGGSSSRPAKELGVQQTDVGTPGQCSDDGQRQSSSVVSRSSETSPCTSKSHALPAGSCSQTPPTLRDVSHLRRRSNSETRSNPEVAEGRSEEEEEEDDDERSRNRHSRRSTPSRSATMPNAQRLLRTKRSGGSSLGKSKGGGVSQMEEPKITEVCYLTFARTFLISGQESVLTLWVGTSFGSVFVHQLDVPAEEKKRAEDGIGCCLAKEINFRRHHPIVYISVLTRSMRPVSRIQNGDLEGEGHSVIIVTQCQIKLFSLPTLKLTSKFNFVGSPDSLRICSAGVVSFISKSDENYVENDLVCLSNVDQLLVFNFPQLRTQLRANNLKVDRSMSQLSILSNFGEVFLFNSPSEVHRLSLSTHTTAQNWCTLELKPGCSRPPLLPSGEGIPSTDHQPGGNEAEPTLPRLVVSEHRAENGGGGREEAGGGGDYDDNRSNELSISQSCSSPDRRTSCLNNQETESDVQSLDNSATSSNPVSTTTATASMATGSSAAPVMIRTSVVAQSRSSQQVTPSRETQVTPSHGMTVRSVTSSRTLVTRSTVARSVDGELLTETSSDVERVNIGRPVSNCNWGETDV